MQIILEQLAPFRELGKQQSSISSFHHLVKDFFEALQLHGPLEEILAGTLLLEGKGRVVADLLELGEQPQHLAMTFAARCARNGIQGVFNGFGIQRLLLFAQTHPFAQFHLLGQIRDDRFVGLQSPEDERSHPGFEVAQG